MPRKIKDAEGRPQCCGRTMWKGKGLAQSGRIRYMCPVCKKSTTGSPDSAHADPGYDVQLAARRHADIRERVRARKVKRFVVTCAQDSTGKFNPFWRALLKYCEFRDAELIVIPVNYKNVTAYTANQKYKRIWDTDLHPYIIDKPLRIGGNVCIRPDIKIPVTTFNPLSGKEPIEGKTWTVFGHPQFAMESVASPIGKPAKRMYTTGAVTVRNYSQTNAGAKAEFHHVHGALIIEVEGRHAFVRQLNADGSGGFYDLDTYYDESGVYEGGRVLALVTGDEHVKSMKRSVRQATYDDPDSIVNVLHPEYVVRHDVLDGYAGSHHHEHDDVIQFTKFHKRDHDYRKELDEVVNFINETTPPDATNVIVASNHHEHLAKWLNRTDPRKDPQNALLIHELKYQQYRNALRSKRTDPFEIYVSPRMKHDTLFLSRHQSFTLMNVEYAQHGDYGLNGARGNAATLARTTFKMVIGHSHGARIVKGVYQVGTSTGTQEYERGFGARTNTHCIQYPNGKRTLIDIFGRKWRGS